jgi:class 3 adenylate cyclase/pimeloyl-ACP methyl ester carboxylesterase
MPLNTDATSPDSVRPPVRFAPTGSGLRIAYAITGTGPPLLFTRALNSHVEELWDEPPIRQYFEALGQHFSIVRHDARGNGLSDQVENVDLEGLVEDVRAVADDADLDAVTLYGQGYGAPVAIAFAARFPARVRHLVLYSGYARGQALPISDTFIEAMRTMPEAAAAIMAHASYPDQEAVPRRIARQTVRYIRPETAAAYLELARSVDVLELLAGVRAPTLFMHPEHSPTVPSRLGREMAAGIEHALFVTIPGGAYNPWAERAFKPTLRAIGEMIGVSLIPAPQGRNLAVLRTDIVGSTAMTQRVGDVRSRELHQTHDTFVREAVQANRGWEVAHTGDGMVASFLAVDDAVRAAISVQRGLTAWNRASADESIEVRIGIAAGEVVEEGEKMYGQAFQLVTRLTDKAKPGQILISEAAQETASEDFEYGATRSLQLKGFTERVRAREVGWRPLSEPSA